ncbi:hypothetical protein GE21DRAFT_6091 [Neurospora crassa]|uniref:Uncharacterized protein n=2 Tax=Neurospora crassa TaxID=5141 RepID=Q7RZ54_NEUCR|nr:hypothetical protein NCU04420 [Neurospora crassa OR74A]EAA28261.1 hypothetical protein NCU04420 [Neurospora crassa OR74A]KHE88574.1 hypothetical protein GE21DRAFT_6091 [Neurospora crassa]CAF06025.1 hypothetical protein G21B4.400 [Neurospora crassa]|eukprot:XP_957497.1 hypothetical protein NCU04420 [Neurospora crassa OR74A]
MDCQVRFAHRQMLGRAASRLFEARSLLLPMEGGVRTSGAKKRKSLDGDGLGRFDFKGGVPYCGRSLGDAVWLSTSQNMAYAVAGSACRACKVETAGCCLSGSARQFASQTLSTSPHSW